MKKYIISLLSVLLTACQTHLPLLSQDDNPENQVCINHTEQTGLADVDYLLYANRMVDDLIQNDQVQKRLTFNRLKIAITHIDYKEDRAMSDVMNVDLTSVNQAIKNRLIRSGQFIMVDNQDNSDVSLSGYFTNSIKENNHCIEYYEQFFMQLKDNHSQYIIWSEQKEFK
ncbi:MAG: hypothetical protein KAI02_01775 [Gammaproteobacteria bacterium]|nr:hypothetical protein [Gammaproteobacteria bacterium]